MPIQLVIVLHTMWSPKGGVGLSVTAAAAAGAFAKQHGSAVLVDLCGDQPALLGMADQTGPGVLDWLGSEGATEDSLQRLLVDAPAGVELLPMGTAESWPSGRIDGLIAGLEQMPGEVVIDAGVFGPPGSAQGAPHRALVEALIGASRSLLVISSCYLALKHAIQIDRRTDGLVVVADPGRALTGRDISDLLGVPLLAQIERDPSLARTVDAGLFLRRPSRSLDSALRRLAVTA